MTASQKLNDYLDRFSSRLGRLYIVRGTAVLTCTLVVIALIAAWLSIDAGFASNVVITGRLALIIAIASIIYLFILQPLKQINHKYIKEIESRTPDLEGRIETYSQIAHENNPFKELLAEDALKINAGIEPEQKFQNKEFNLPWGIVTASIVILVWMTIAGPGFMNYSLRNLLAGWAFPGLTPPQTISLMPGDETVRIGGNLEITAQMSGFDPDVASLFVKVEDKAWQEVDMLKFQNTFQFTFFSIRDPMQYYVSANGIKSPEYQVDVIQLPNIQSITLTYTYPEWTKRAPETIEFAGDIRTVRDTKIDMQVVTDAELPSGVLVLNDVIHDLSAQDRTNETSFEVTDDGEYYIAAKLGGETVRLSDDYFITIIDDERPDIQFTRPGRDWNASPIEEVTTRVKVKDDYALESLQLRYSINGGEWQTAELPADQHEAELDHVFFLEQIETPASDTNEVTSLVPGDLIAYYAEAKDRLNTSRTDMFFIEIQPFDRRYSQSQMSGGGGGGGGGQNPQQEISQRQKEIVVSTWNLIREQAEQEEGDILTVDDNAVLLSELQTTLAEQTQTLADRTRARQLTNTDASIRNFVEHMELAAEAMRPAAESLAAVDLEQAIQPEQEALQHLLRAEAMFNDIQVSFNQGGGGGGGGGQAGRDLADMFELEMDMEKNQYETGSQASPQQAQQEADDTMRQLEELARRQEKLAENMNRQQSVTEAQRWQQEMLRREAEELQRRLQQQEQDQQQQQQQALNQSGQSQQQGQSPGQTSGQSSSQSSSGDTSGEQSQQSELNRRLSSAIRAMNDAAEAMQNNPGSDEQQRATEEAQRQLENAQEQLAQAQQRNMQDAFRNMAADAETLHRDQTRMDNTLHEGARTALQNREDEDDRVENPFTYEEEELLAEGKRELLADLQRLRQQMEQSARDFRQDSPRAARELDNAGAELRESEIDTRLNLAASYIEQGAALYLVNSESVVTEALRKLSDSLRRADALVNERTNQPGERNLSDALAQTRALRRDLQQLSPESGQQQSQETGQQSSQQGQQAGNAGQSTSAQNGERSRAGGGGWNGWDAWRGGWAGGMQPEQFERLREEIAQTSQVISPLIPELREQGLDQREISEIYDLLRQLPLEPMDGEKNDSIIQSEVTRALALLEQLELKLEQGIEGSQSAHVRSEVTDPVPEQYQDAVAEYYRKLSRQN